MSAAQIIAFEFGKKRCADQLLTPKAIWSTRSLGMVRVMGAEC